MTLRIAQGSVKAALDAPGDVRIAQTGVKAALTTGVLGELRIARSEVKVAVRTFPRQTIALAVPPAHTTHSRAPFIRSSTREG